MPRPERPRVVLVGGGVATLEALLVLRNLLGGHPGIDIVAPTAEFIYRPLSVAEPFDLIEPRHFDLALIATDQNARLHRGVVEFVDPGEKRVGLHGGELLPYDYLLVAVGASPREWLTGAVPFAGPQDVPGMRALLDELAQGTVGRVAFTAPAGLTWTLPLYELALLTATRVGELGLADVRLTLVTPEASPLKAFGPAAARHIHELFSDRGITLKTGALAQAFKDDRLRVEPDGWIEADRVVALPELEGRRIGGLPCDEHGFIAVNAHGSVQTMPGVYAAGDVTARPVKQGGLAAQQADAAAEAIAARLGAAVEPRPYQPVLRGQLLTGLTPAYLTARKADVRPRESSAAVNPLWWPPSKIAGRYLAPYLADHTKIGAPGELADRPPSRTRYATAAAADHEEIRKMAVAFADIDAGLGDYSSALGWLDTIEQLDGLLPPGYVEKREAWRRQAEATP